MDGLALVSKTDREEILTFDDGTEVEKDVNMIE